MESHYSQENRKSINSTLSRKFWVSLPRTNKNDSRKTRVSWVTNSRTFLNQRLWSVVMSENYPSRPFPWWRVCLWWTRKTDWQRETRSFTHILMVFVMPRRNSNAWSTDRASRPCADKRAPAILDRGCINRSLRGLEVDSEQMLKLLRLAILMYNKFNRRSSQSLPVRRLTRPMIQSLSHRGESQSKRINWVKTKISWRISETPPYQMDRSSQMWVSQGVPA